MVLYLKLREYLSTFSLPGVYKLVALPKNQLRSYESLKMVMHTN